MAKPLRPKRGTTAKNDAFVGLASEITVDTDKHSIRVHDGVTAGGHELLPTDKNDARYVRTVNGKAPSNGNVAVDIPSIDGLVQKFGNRGSVGGYTTPNVTASAVTIDGNSSDDTQVTGAVNVTVANGSASTSWFKAVSLTSASATVTLGSSWEWAGGKVPEVSANAVLALYWINNRGLANLIKGA